MPPRRTESAASHPSSPPQSSSPPRRIHPEKIARRAAVSPGLDKPAFTRIRASGRDESEASISHASRGAEPRQVTIFLCRCASISRHLVRLRSGDRWDARPGSAFHWADVDLAPTRSTIPRGEESVPAGMRRTGRRWGIGGVRPGDELRILPSKRRQRGGREDVPAAATGKQ
jgi:hypothetical protein